MERDIDKLIEGTLSAWDNTPNAKVPTELPNRVLQRLAEERNATQRSTYMVAAASLLLVGLNVAVLFSVIGAPGSQMTSELKVEQTLLKQMQQEYFHNDSYGVAQ